MGNKFLVAGGVIAAGLAYGIDKAAEFEKQLSYFKAVSDSTTSEMELIRQKALQLGRDSAYGASTVANAFAELGKAGVPARDIINGVGDAIVYLAAAGDVDLSQSALIVVNALNTFHLKATDAVNVANLLAGAANASTIEISDLATSLKYAGSVAAALGIPIDDVTAALAELGNNGIRGSTGGTALRKILLDLTPATKAAGAEMKELGIITKDGTNQFFDAKGQAKSLSDIINVLHNSLQGLTKEQQVSALNTLFGNRAVASALILANQGATAFQNMKTEVGKVTAEQVMKERLDNLAGSLKILKSSIETAFIANGSVVQGILKGWVDNITHLVNAFSNLSPHTQELIFKIAAIVAGLLLVTGVSFKFIGGMINMVKTARELYQGFKLVSGIIGPMIQSFGELMAALLTNPVFLIIAAIALLAIGLYELYQHSETFRHAVDALWQGMQKAWDAITKIVYAAFEFIKSHWLDLVLLLSGPLGIIIEAWRLFGDKITAFAKRIADDVGSAITRGFEGIIHFFEELPGRAAAGLNNVIAAVEDFVVKLPARMAYALGFLVGLYFRPWVEMYRTTVEWGPKIIKATVNFFEELPGRLVGFFNAIWDAYYALEVRLLNGAMNLGVSFFNAIVNFFELLPGRLIGFFNMIWDGFYAFMVNMINGAINLGSSVLNSIVSFFEQLPGRVAGFFTDLWNRILGIGGNISSSSATIGSNAYHGIIDWIEKIPGAAAGAMGNVIQAFEDVIGKAFDAAKKLGSNLWNGFKKGLGISSPSYIEKAMFAMVDNVQKSTGQLQSQVLKIQQIHNSIPKLTTSNLALAGIPSSSTTAAHTIAGTNGSSTTATIPGQGDTFNITGADERTAVDLAEEILFKKQIRSR